MIYVRDVIDLCRGKLFCGNLDLECSNFCIDTRNINVGDVFVGIKGENFNGNNFYKSAIDKGASICILDDDTVIESLGGGCTVILVDDTISCLQKLAKYKRELYKIPVVAITGSVGKTSVKDIICSVLGTKFRVCSTKGNLNNHIGVPLTVLSLKDEDVLIVEMGMNHLGEIHDLSNIVKPTIGVITNVGTAHIGNLGSRENILKAKLEILDGMYDGCLVVNNDNDLLRNVKYDNLITIGIDNDSDYMAYDIVENEFSSGFYVNGEYVNLPVGSRAFIYNSLFAFAIGIKLGMTLDEISDALRNFKLSPHRLELFELDKFSVIDDTYNASFDSVKNSLELLSKVARNKVFIFGDILELDEFAEDIHKDIGKLVIDNKINVLICVGELSKYSYEVASDSKCKCYYFENNNKLLEKIDDILSNGDMVLVKGSHGMNLVDIVNYLRNS